MAPVHTISPSMAPCSYYGEDRELTDVLLDLEAPPDPCPDPSLARPWCRVQSTQVCTDKKRKLRKQSKLAERGGTETQYYAKWQGCEVTRYPSHTLSQYKLRSVTPVRPSSLRNGSSGTIYDKPVVRDPHCTAREYEPIRPTNKLHLFEKDSISWSHTYNTPSTPGTFNTAHYSTPNIPSPFYPSITARITDTRRSDRRVSFDKTVHYNDKGVLQRSPSNLQNERSPSNIQRSPSNHSNERSPSNLPSIPSQVKLSDQAQHPEPTVLPCVSNHSLVSSRETVRPTSPAPLQDIKLPCYNNNINPYNNNNSNPHYNNPYSNPPYNNNNNNPYNNNTPYINHNPYSSPPYINNPPYNNNNNTSPYNNNECKPYSRESVRDLHTRETTLYPPRDTMRDTSYSSCFDYNTAYSHLNSFTSLPDRTSSASSSSSYMVPRGDFKGKLQNYLHVSPNPNQCFKKLPCGLIYGKSLKSGKAGGKGGVLELCVRSI